MTAVYISIAVLAAFVLLFVLNRRPVKRTSAEVAVILRALLDAKLDSAEWDYFISVGIRDPELERIRASCEEMWVEGSPFLEAEAIDPNCLNERGRERVKSLLQECEQHGNDTAPPNQKLEPTR